MCIATGIRYAATKKHPLAKVHYARITGTREEKLAKIKAIGSFGDVTWEDCYEGPGEPLWPKTIGNYLEWPLLTNLWPWQLNGVQWKRTWPVGETREVLEARWRALVSAPKDQSANLMRETDARTVGRQIEPFPKRDEQTPVDEDGVHKKLLPSIASLAADMPSVAAERYAWRSFDRHWILPDNRFCDRPRPDLWNAHGKKQIYLTGLLTGVLGGGPAAVGSAYPPDLHYFCGRGGKDIIPLWRDAAGTQPNLPRGLLEILATELGTPISAQNFFAYSYAVLSAPGYVETFAEELTVPGPRLPVTRDPALFARAVALGKKLLFLHTYAERFLSAGEKHGIIPAGKAKCLQGIPTKSDHYPADFTWTVGAMLAEGVLRVGTGEFSPVSQAVWDFSVSGYNVLRGWLGFRMKKRSGKKSSPLDDIRPAAWTAALTTELLELLWVLEATTAAQPELDSLLTEIIASPLFTAVDFPVPTTAERNAPADASKQAHPEFDL